MLKLRQSHHPEKLKEHCHSLNILPSSRQQTGINIRY